MERDYTIDYDKKIIDFMNYLEVKFTEESNRIDRYSVRVIKGRRFDRIVTDSKYTYNYIHCFVERKTGNIYKELSKMNLQVTLSSKIENYNLNTDVILVDSYGEVSKFYHISKSVFLGKSLINSIKNDSGQKPDYINEFSSNENLFTVINHTDKSGFANVAPVATAGALP